jgi:hypothetical protein
MHASRHEIIPGLDVRQPHRMPQLVRQREVDGFRAKLANRLGADEGDGGEVLG